MISIACVTSTVRVFCTGETAWKWTEGGLLAVGGDFGREVLDAASATALAQDVAIQRITASALPLGRQQETTFLTDVTVDMEASVQRHYPDGLLLAPFWHDGLTAHGAARRIFSMKVVYAVYLRGGVHSEGHPVQAAVAHHACETARVIGLSHGPKDPVQDGLGAL